MRFLNKLGGALILAAALTAIGTEPAMAANQELQIPSVEEQNLRIEALQRVSTHNKGKGFIDSHRAFRVELNEITHLPDYITGTFPTDSRSQRPEKVGAAFIAQNQEILGLSQANLSTKVLAYRTDPSGMGHARFQVLLDGVPIEGAQILTSSEGRIIRTVVSTLVPISSEKATVVVGKKDAVLLAQVDLQMQIDQKVNLDSVDLRRYDKMATNGSKELVWINQDLLNGKVGPTQLAWRLEIAKWVYYVSATDGSIITQYDNLQASLDRQTYTAHNTTTLPGTLILDEGTQDPASSTQDIDILAAHDYAAFVYDYYAQHHGRDSWDGLGSPLQSTVHYGEDVFNAYWNGSQMIYGDADFMVQDDICAHEITHGVIQSTAGLIYLHQPGAINEAIADAMAFLATDDPELGEGLDYGVLRDISDPTAYGYPDHMDDYYRLPIFVDNGGVHIYSGIVAQAVYLLAHGGEKYDVIVPAQGLQLTEEIWYRALTTYMTPITNFSGTRYAVEAACLDIAGSGSETCDAVSRSFEAQGII